ncbi:hypothetical protein QBC36DRAFT_313651 [Triangularia setosa]|uniref:Uncharacterized protein n=1 Tax=Triangularia setosa TaxID=2587417 RepID=A0AAN6W1T7_9PEZI|nr:hypothetical protein QBC36DRAFT_313651 [Podospora setosa]
MLSNIALALCTLRGFFGSRANLGLSRNRSPTRRPAFLTSTLSSMLNGTSPQTLMTPTVPRFRSSVRFSKAVTQMEAQYPGWNATFQNQQPSNAAISTAAQYDRDYYLCGEPWVKTGWLAVKYGIANLNKVTSAAPKNGPGLNNCGRVSCGYNAAIYWCNDRDRFI